MLKCLCGVLFAQGAPKSVPQSKLGYCLLCIRNVYCFGVERVLDFVSYSSVAIRHFTALQIERPVHEQGCCRSDHAGISLNTLYSRCFGPCPIFPLAGKIPPELGKLHALKLLALSSNNLEGELNHFLN